MFHCWVLLLQAVSVVIVMKYLSHIIVFLVGAILSAVIFVMLFPPSTVNLGIEIGRKLGLAAAEARYAEYEKGHTVLQIEVEEAEKRTSDAEESLKAFRKKSVTKTRKLKKAELSATLAQRQAAQEQPVLEETVDTSFASLEDAVEGSDQATKNAVFATKIASRELVDNCLSQLRAANQESGALRLQLDLKSRELVAVWKSRNAWQDRAEKEKALRKDAEAYIKDVKDSGFYIGIGGSAGYFRLLTGHSGPGAGIALNTGWRFR